MSLSSRIRVSLCYALPGLLVAGCSLATEVRNPEVTFDGERCQYEGPEAIVEGQVVIVLNNPTDHQYIHVHVVKNIVEGKTWQDHVEYIGGLYTPLDLGPAPWARNITPTSLDGDPSMRYERRYFREWEFPLEPGRHVIYCVAHRGDPKGDWLGALFEVIPASSE